MSQKKVDQYKEQKANRKALMKKEKMMLRLEVGAIVVVLVALIGWFGYSVYDNAQATAEANKEAVTTGIYIQGMQDFLDDLDAGTNVEGSEEAETETEKEIEEEAEEEVEEETTEDAAEEAVEADSSK